MEKIAYLLVVLFFAFEVKSQDYLEPEISQYSTHEGHENYIKAVRFFLTKNLIDNSPARVIVTPSFSSEYIISLENDSLGFFLFFRTFQKSIGNEMHLKNDLNLNPVVEYKNRIDSTLAEQIHELFYQVTSQTRYPPLEYFTIPFGKNAGKKMRKHVMGTDGTNYHFSSAEFGIRTGKTWSPKDGTTMARLVQVVNIMKAYSYDASNKVELEITTQNLLTEITGK